MAITKDEYNAILREVGQVKSLINIPVYLRNDKQIVITALKRDGCELKYASESLRNDPEVVLLAGSKTSDAYVWASESLLDDENFMYKAISISPDVILLASIRLKNNHDLIIHAINQSADVLRFLSDDVRDNTQIILYAISKNSDALRYASDRIRNSSDIVLQAVKKHGRSIMFARTLFQNKEIVNAAAKNNPHFTLRYLPERSRSLITTNTYINIINRFPKLIMYITKNIINMDFAEQMITLPKYRSSVLNTPFNVLNKLAEFVELPRTIVNEIAELILIKIYECSKRR